MAVGRYADGEDLARLGVSSALIEGLRAWQESWEARVSIPADPGDFACGLTLSIRLVRQLQAELPGHRIYLGINGDRRPAEELQPALRPHLEDLADAGLVLLRSGYATLLPLRMRLAPIPSV